MMITHSESIKELAGALAKVAAEIENPHKTSENPHFRSRYADLAEIVNTARPVLAKHGVTPIQSPGMEGDLLTVDTMLVHTSGEWVRGRAATPLPKADPQGVGSATTYLRRYSLAAMLGLAQEDDDANAASVLPQAHRQKSQPNGSGGPAAPASEKQIGLIRNLVKSSVFTEDERNGVERRVQAGIDKAKASEIIEWAQQVMADRKEPATVGASADPYDGYEAPTLEDEQSDLQF